MAMSKDNCEINNLFVCLFCELKFISHAEMLLHMQYHNIDKPYFCIECDNKYTSKHALLRHMESHKIEKPTYTCSKCDYLCNNKRNLTNHEMAHSSDKSFNCTKCNFKTISKFSLSKHNKVHNKGNKYKCKDCDFECQFLNALTKHANEMHENKKPFACLVCQKFYTNKTNLTIHMKTHAINDNENEVLMNINPCDENNNIETIKPETLISNKNIGLNEKWTKNCVSCKRNLKLKKLWGATVFDDKLSFALNKHICELALEKWEVSWDINNNLRICLTCKLYLISGKNYSSHSKNRGRPKIKQVEPIVIVCSACHTKVRKTNKKHTCSAAKMKKNITKIIDHSETNLKLVSKAKIHPVFSVTEDDLNLHQSVSRLSSRQMQKQKLLWKLNLKNQGFKVKIAGQHKIDELRKERIDDLFEETEIRANIATEKNPVYKLINVVYCNNICELAKRVAKNRNTILDTCKLQGDHGQGSLKLSIQFNFSNSVNTLIILAITQESKESILTLKEMERLVNPEILKTKLGMTVLRTGDIQYLQLSIGIKTGNASYPCPFCNWRMTGDNRDDVDAVCSPRNIKKDLEHFIKRGSNRNLSHLFHGQQGDPAFIGDPCDVFVPPSLHINLGLVNHVLEKMEIKHTQGFIEKELYEKAKVRKTSYQGGKFEGNEVQAIVKTFNKISWPKDHPFIEYCKLFYALETTNEFVFSIHIDLTDDDIVNIAISIREVLNQWEYLKNTLGLSETVKLHVYAMHCLEFAMQHKCTPASYGEQDGEMLHRRFKQTLESYKTLGKKALLYTVKMWNFWNF